MCHTEHTLAPSVVERSSSVTSTDKWQGWHRHHDCKCQTHSGDDQGFTSHL